MDTMTITEALAQIKTIGKRLEKKQQNVTDYLFRHEQMKDPHENDGGSAAMIERELQSTQALRERIVRIRRAINRANEVVELTIQDETRTLAAWLIWKRECAPKERDFYAAIRSHLVDLRRQAQAKGFSVLTEGSTARAPTDIVVNLNELELSRSAERLEGILGDLDGQLSLKNATTMVEVD